MEPEVDTDAPKALTKAVTPPSSVEVHPLVLLSVVDHYTRMNAKLSTARRVVGILIGNVSKQSENSTEPVLDISNSFAVPFEEDSKDSSVWFLDINYAMEMYKMFKKVWSKTKVLGWYSTGPSIRVNDLRIHHLIRSHFCPNPVFLMVNPHAQGVPAMAYYAMEWEGSEMEFRNIASRVVSLEAEDIGVEHLLRELTDSTIKTLSTKVQDRNTALDELVNRLGIIETYLTDVVDDKMPVSQEVLTALQEIGNLLPRIQQVKNSPSLISVTNDEMLCIFVASISRAIMAIYDLVCNKRKLRRDAAKREEEKKAKEEKEAKEKAEKDGKKDGEGAKEPAAEAKDGAKKS